MFGLIAAIIAAVVSFASGASGMGGIVGTQSAVPITPSVNAACYNPQPNVKITLKWPDNFTNVSDARAVLNPASFKGVPSSFNTDPSCQNLVLNNQTSRTFILVRTDVRISSCKTDEGGGPLGKGVCTDTSLGAAKANRGTCNINGYTDLRKIADATDASGQPVEIFWNPFSYNVGCNYQQNDNCGPGDRRNLNLKDFIYVLRSRDAFSDPNNPGKNPSNIGCPVEWDAGSVNLDACSHHFDVYMAEDFYNASLTAAATNDPENPYYFIQQVIQNCKEQSTFIPAPQANLTIPPLFLKSPFVWQNDKTIYATDKIVPTNSQETINYTNYIWTFPNNFYNTQTASTANLLRDTTDTSTGPFTLCPATTGGVTTLANGEVITATPTPPPNQFVQDCYDPLGNIFLKDSNGQTVKFDVYSKLITPQTFTLVKDTDTSTGYVYNITFQDYPENNRNDKSLQFRAMQMIQRNEWTWATPWCKPAIYMYPEKPTAINVKLNLDGQMTVSNPVYDSQNGWSVVAQPDGKLGEPLTLSDYPYLYYEADLKGVNIPKEGFVYSKADLPDSLKSLMKEIGFNDKETSDFLAYWLPKLTDKPYYFVTLLPENVINQKEKLTFSVTPDTLIRSRFVFEGLDAPVSVKPLTDIQTHARTGFTVTDWGGTIVGKSCSNVTVK